MIPKIIHYCWLSNDPFPPQIQRCINSWSKYMPNYQIKRWSTETFNINSIPLVKEAYEARKWAFAADYIRCYALYTEGGIYLDSDVLLHENIQPLLEGKNYVSAIEFHPINRKTYKRQIDEDGNRLPQIKFVQGVGLQAAFMASVAGHPLLKDCLNFYNKISLTEILENSYLAPIVQIQAAEKYGVKYKDELQELDSKILLYPTSVIGQNENEIKGRALTHMGAASWTEQSTKRKLIKLLDKYGLYKTYVRIKNLL